MAKTYRTAMGKLVDIDMLRLANETEIAVGNMKVNARGDELGPGGKVVKTRAQIMQEYHQLNANTTTDKPINASSKTRVVPQTVKPTTLVDDWQEPAAPAPVVETPPPAAPAPKGKPRGSFAEAIAEETEVTQELLDPAVLKQTQTLRRI